jgi:hypothetical protein
MGQPVKLSDELVLDARLTGEVFQRSIAGQVEFWARLGRSFEDLLDGRNVRTLARTNSARPLSELIDTMESADGQERLAEYLESTPFPHFEQLPEDETMLIRTEANGQRSVGRFVSRQFVVDARLTAMEQDIVTPNDLAREYDKTPLTIRRWLRSLPRFAENDYQRYRFRKDDPILEEAVLHFAGYSGSAKKAHAGQALVR